MVIVRVKKVSAGTVYKLMAIGLSVGFFPIFIIFGIMAANGMDVLTWNEQSVTGIKALIVGPLMGLMMTLLFTAFLGSVTAFGLWIYSFIKPLNIKYTAISQK